MKKLKKFSEMLNERFSIGDLVKENPNKSGMGYEDEIGKVIEVDGNSYIVKFDNGETQEFQNNEIMLIKIKISLYYPDEDNLEIDDILEKPSPIHTNNHYCIYIHEEYINNYKIITTTDDGSVYNIDDLLNGVGNVLNDDEKIFDSMILDYKDIYKSASDLLDNKEKSELFNRYLIMKKTDDYDI